MSPTTAPAASGSDADAAGERDDYLNDKQQQGWNKHDDAVDQRRPPEFGS
ncbi:hypothetical protein [Brevibacterium ravenspurgense]